MAGQPGSADSPGVRDVIGALMPFAAMAATAAGQPTAGNQALYYMRLMQQEDEAERERAQKRAAAEATGQMLEGMGYKTVPGMGSSELLQGATLQDTQKARAAAQAKLEREAADAERQRKVLGTIGNIRTRAYQDDPDQLIAELRAATPQIGHTAEMTGAFDKTLQEIHESGKRLAQARAVGGPYTRVPTYQFVEPGKEPSPVYRMDPGAPQGPADRMASPNPFGVVVPPNVRAMQDYMVRTGAMPDKTTAESFKTMFGVDLSGVPGGPEVQREIDKPTATSVHYVDDGKGNVVPVTTFVYRDGTTKTVQGDVQRGIAKVEKPAKPDKPTDAEVHRSLAAIVAGQPERALPEHRGMTADQARAWLYAEREFSQAPNTGEATRILSNQLEEAEDQLAEAQKNLTSANSVVQTRKSEFGASIRGYVPEAEAAAQAAAAAVERLTVRRNRLRDRLEQYIPPPRWHPPGSQPPAPAGGTDAAAARERAQRQGVVK